MTVESPRGWADQVCTEVQAVQVGTGPLSAGDRVVADGWTPVDGHVSTRRELDGYEWACWGPLASWALDHPADPDSSHVLATANTRRCEWLRVYRDTWGFVSLVLRQTSG